MGPRAGLERCRKSRLHWDSMPGRPARSQSLYRLSYPAHTSTWRILSHSTRCKVGNVTFRTATSFDLSTTSLGLQWNYLQPQRSHGAMVSFLN